MSMSEDENPPTSPYELYRLLNSTDQAIYISLGRALMTSDLAITEPPDKEAEEKGRRWFEGQKRLIASVLCGNEKIKQAFGIGKTDQQTLLKVLTNVLALHFTGLPIVTIAVLIIRKGYKYFCGES
jgi:hypothetical protein